MKIRYKKLHPNAKKPRRAYRQPGQVSGSIGYDVWAAESGIIPPRTQIRIPLGFAAEFDDNHVALVEDRGGMGMKGQTKFAGVIDPDFRGEWAAVIYNATDKPFVYDTEKAIAQILFIKTEEAEDQEEGWSDSLSETLRGGNQHGSSDKVFNETLSLQSTAGESAG